MRTYDVTRLPGFSTWGIYRKPGYTAAEETDPQPTELTARDLAVKYATGGTPESWALAQMWATLAVADEVASVRVALGPRLVGPETPGREM